MRRHFKRYIGIDIHKKTATWVAMDEEKKLLGEGKLPMAGLKGWAQKNLTQEDRVVIEATGNSHHVYGFLAVHAGEVLMADPLAMHDRTKSKRKTDRVDAAALAEALASDYVQKVWVPDEVTWERREWASHRHALSKQLTVVKNQLRAMLYRHGLEYKGDHILDEEAVEYAQKSSLSELVQGLFRSQWRIGRALEQEIQQLDRELSSLTLKEEENLRLMTLPGVGPQAALIIRSAVGDVSRFSSSKKLASYAGLVPRVSKSDETVYYGSITKHGRSLLRWIMVEAANAGVLTPGPLKDRYHRFRRKGKTHQEAVVGVARHMLELVWHMLTKKQVFRYASANYLVTKMRGVLRDAHGRCPQKGATTLAKTLMGWKACPATSLG